MHPSIQQHKNDIAKLCERFGVSSLAVFGSAARGNDFDQRNSDADFLIEFSPNHDLPSLDTYFALKHALSHLLNRPVDLLDSVNIENPYLLKQINQDKVVIYEA